MTPGSLDCCREKRVTSLSPVHHISALAILWVQSNPIEAEALQR